MNILEQPLNAEERYLYSIAIRLDKVIELLTPDEEDDTDVEDTQKIITEEIEEVEIEEFDYTGWTIAQIKEELDSRDVEYKDRALKADLLELLE